MKDISGQKFTSLKWMTQEGEPEDLLSENLESFKLSPDGTRLAYELSDGDQKDIWIYDIELGIPTKLTFDPAEDEAPIWSPSGESIVFSSGRNGVKNLYWKPVERGETQRLTESENPQTPWSWHPEGHHLVISEESTDNGSDLRILDLEGNDHQGWKAGEIKDFQASQFEEVTASFSPDGRWLAYASDINDGFQVFVQRFPDGGRQLPISGEEGRMAMWPIWSQTNKELIFSKLQIEGDSQLFKVGYSLEDNAFIPESPVQLQNEISFSGRYSNNYDLDPSGRLLIRSIVEEEDQGFEGLIFFENFFAYLHEVLEE